MNGSFVTRMHSLQVPRTQPIVIQPQTVSPKTLQTQADECLEQFIVESLGKDKYKLLEWRSNRETYRHYKAESFHYPHLEFESQKSGKRFALKCSWKNKLQASEVWATNLEIQQCLDYQDKKNIAVYILIAFGENPCAPEETYVASLGSVKDQPSIDRSELHAFNFKAQLESGIFA